MNYSKWDNIELSDDEDVEVHPNIDRESFLRWRREAIHQRRAEKAATKAQREEELEKLKKEFETASKSGASTKEIEALREKITQAELVIHQEAEKEKKENLLTSENISKDGFEKTLINKEDGKAKPPKEAVPVSQEVIAEMVVLEEIEDFQRFLGRHPEVIGSKEVLDALFSYIYSQLKAGDEKKARYGVRLYHLLQYLQQAEQGSGIYWVFKRLLKKDSEQRREFEKEVDSRLDVLASQFRAKTAATNQSASQAPEEQIVELLPQQIRAAIRQGDNAKLDSMLRGLSLEEVEKVLLECKEAELKETTADPDDSPLAAYEGNLQKIRALRSMPTDIRLALQAQNTLGFLEALKKLPYEQAEKVLDNCVETQILKLGEGGLEKMKESLRPESDPRVLKRAEVFHSLPEDAREAVMNRDVKAFQEALSKMDPQKKRETFKKCEEVGILNLKETEAALAADDGSELRILIALVVLLVAIVMGLYSYMAAHNITYEQTLEALYKSFKSLWGDS